MGQSKDSLEDQTNKRNGGIPSPKDDRMALN